MSPRRDPAPPPELPGHSYVKLLGIGGFADVFLYERQLPRMPVAVKVLVGGVLTAEDEDRFTAEANTMARFSGHPYIVGVLNAGVSSDGRPHIVMQYYPKDNLAVRCRRNLLTVPEALQIGIQVASAVETAHRAGALHRDIKPANILTGEFGEPGLTDFGIAGTVGTGAAEGPGDGLSIPWAPPEAFDSDALLDERSDIYSLSATVYNLLAGHSPFELVGQGNRAIDLMDRIERMSVPAIERGDVPDSLVRVIRQAMAKDPDRRHPSAMAFARDLQAVEQELRLKMTTVVVPDDPADVSSPDPVDEMDETRGRISQRIRPQAPDDADLKTRPPRPGGPRPAAIFARVAGASAVINRENVPGGGGAGLISAPLKSAVASAGYRSSVVDDATGTRKRPAAVVEPVVDSNPSDSEVAVPGRRGVLVGVAVVAVLALVVGLSLAFSSHGATKSPAASTTTTAPLGTTTPVAPTFNPSLSGGIAAVTWTNPSPQTGDTYDVTIRGQQPKSVSGSSFSLPWTGTTLFCVLVQTVNSSGMPSANSSYLCAA
jgi:serine/threonine protein kinase